MSRLFITGDVHGSLELKKLSNKNFPLAKQLTKNDIVLIAGDAGFMWDNSAKTRYWDDWAEDRPFTICAARGNHENYSVINTLPKEPWNDGIVRRVRPHVMYLENGEIFNIANHSFFCLGGASSHDKAYRIEGKSWWPEEIPSYEELEHAFQTLKKANFNVDYILTHCAPNSIVDRLYRFLPEYDTLTNYLQKCVLESTTFRAWMCGHYHIDRTFDDKFYCLYNDIMEILTDGTIVPV